MREIDNNLTNVNFKGAGVHQKSLSDGGSSQQNTPSASLNRDEKVTDLKNMPALGKTQVASDSLEADISFLGKHPELVQTLNDLVDNYAKNHTEEQTLQLLDAMHQEFVK